MSKNSNHFFHFLLLLSTGLVSNSPRNQIDGVGAEGQHSTQIPMVHRTSGGGTPGTLQLIPKLKGRSFCSLTWAIPISWIDLLLSPRPILLPLWAKMVARIVPTVHHALFCSMAPLWGLEPELDQQGHRKSPMSGSGMGRGEGVSHTHLQPLRHRLPQPPHLRLQRLHRPPDRGVPLPHRASPRVVPRGETPIDPPGRMMIKYHIPTYVYFCIYNIVCVCVCSYTSADGNDVHAQKGSPGGLGNFVDRMKCRGR